MTRILLAEFVDEGRFVSAARRTEGARCRVVNSYTPYPVEELSTVLDNRPSRIRPAMFIGGVLMAALAYGLEYYSAVVNYPYNSGGRPLNAWPAFMLVPFATGIFMAAVCGFATFLFEAKLPKLSNPLFGVDGFGRASQDRFLLAVAFPSETDDSAAAVEWLQNAGAITVQEIAP